MITLESAIAPELDALVALLRIFREQITAASLDTKKGRQYVFSMTAVLNWVRNQLDPSKTQTTPFKMPVFEDAQLMALPRAKVHNDCFLMLALICSLFQVQEVVATLLAVIDTVSDKFRTMMASLLTTEYGTRVGFLKSFAIL